MLAFGALYCLDARVMETESKRVNPQDLGLMNTEYLSRYVTETGKIMPRKMTRLSSRQQKAVSKAIKRARSMLLLQ